MEMAKDDIYYLGYEQLVAALHLLMFVYAEWVWRIKLVAHISQLLQPTGGRKLIK